MNAELTFCGIYRNEANNIRRILDIAKEICIDMVLGVQKSEDATLEICREYTDNVIEFEISPPETCKDRIMEKVTTPWTWWMDADELPSQKFIELANGININIYDDIEAVRTPRINYINGLRIEANEDTDTQFRLIRSSVRWNPEKQGQRCHIHPIIGKEVKIDFPIYHHRTLDKIERTTKLWNEYEPKTKIACDKYLEDVKNLLSNSKKLL